MTVLRVKEKQDTSTAQDRLRRLAESLSALFAKFCDLAAEKIRYDQNSMTRLAQDHGLVLDKMFGTTLEELLRFVDKTERHAAVIQASVGAADGVNMLLKGDDPAYVYWAERNDFSRMEPAGVATRCVRHLEEIVYGPICKAQC